MRGIFGAIMGKLTAIQVRNLDKVGRHSDGDGLHLHVRAADRRAWVFRYMRLGRSRDMGLGPYPDVSLAEARAEADQARLMLRQGKDPVDERKRELQQAIEAAERAAVHTFRSATTSLIESKADGWRNAKHKAQWASTLETYAFPIIGEKPVADIETADILNILRPVWREKTETASRLRGRIEAVLDAAKVSGWREGENPARWKGHLSAILPAVSKVRRVVHRPALAWADIGAFMAALRAEAGVGPLCLEFTILTAARSGEARGATWREIDLEKAIWNIPDRRMKAGQAHRVPLSTQVLRLLRALRPEHRGADDHVFPGRIKGQLSDRALVATIERMNEGTPLWVDGDGHEVVPHGFRSTFRDWAEDSGIYAGRLAEAALAHAVKDATIAAYQRGDLFERRRTMMQAWADQCDVASAARTPKASGAS